MARDVSCVCRLSFPQGSCGNTSTFSAIEIEFRICFRVLVGRNTAEVLLQNIDSTPHGSETSRISSAYLPLCRSKAYLPTDTPKTMCPGQCSCRNTGARRGRSESHSPQPPLVGCVPSGTLPRFLQLKSSLESSFEFIPVEKTFYLLLQEHSVPLRRDPRRPESHQPFFSCAGVKAYASTDVPKTTLPGRCSCRNTWCATWMLPQIARCAAPLGGYVPSGTLPRTTLPLTPSRCIPIVEGRVNSPPNHDSSVPAGTFDGFCT
jgi:hypothetical protein